MTRVLLVQLADVGDLILTTPALVAIRQALPNAHLALLTTQHSTAILETGLVDAVHTLSRAQLGRAFFKPDTLRTVWALRAHQYEAVVFFHHFTLKFGTLKFAFIAWATGAPRVIGIDNGNGWFLTESLPDEGFGVKHQAVYWLELVRLLGASSALQRAHVAFDGGVLPVATTVNPRVVIHTGSGGYSLARRWLPEYFARVADVLHQEFNAQIVFVGTSNDGFSEVKPHLQHLPVDLVGKTTLTQLADVIRSADLYIGADSGIMHLAGAVRVPMIALFGSSNHQAWGAWSPQGNVTVLRSAPLCSPCSYVEHHIGAREGCTARTCMRLITPNDVIKSARAILSDRTPIELPSVSYPAPAPAAERFGLLGVWYDGMTYPQAIERIEALCSQAAFHLVILSDYRLALRTHDDFVLKLLFQRAPLVIPCGTAFAWGASWTRQFLPERLDILPLVAQLLDKLAERKRRVFLIGQTAEQARLMLQHTLPALHVVGAMNATDSVTEEDAIVEAIQASGAEVLLVGFDAGASEKWLGRNASRLTVRVGVGVGDVMRDMAGLTPMAPDWVQDFGLGWMYELFRNPKRLNAMWAVPLFVLRVVLGHS